MNLQSQLNIPDQRFQEIIESAQLIKLKWMGIDNFLLLKKADITTIEGLSRQNPAKLHANLVKINKSRLNTPSEAIVKIWIREAKRDCNSSPQRHRER